jgi:hypothetical protein
MKAVKRSVVARGLGEKSQEGRTGETQEVRE